MTKNPAWKRAQLGLAAWAAETTDPNAGGGTAGGVGSWWQRQGSVPLTPTQIYLKTAASNVGWVHQNLLNLNVFNIRDYGAVADGTTDNRTFILAAITAAQAVGGGIIYIPPSSSFYAVKKAPSGSDIIGLTNKQNILFLGDGYASKIRQIGSAGGGETHVFGLLNDCQNIQFWNFYIDAETITSPDPAGQNHGIQIYSTSTAGTNGPRDTVIENMYFGRFPGDAIRLLGNGSTFARHVTDVRVRRCAFDLRTTVGSRTGFSIQRFTFRIVFDHNWITGSHDQQIDFEPTGIPVDGRQGLGGPSQYSIVGNLMDHASQLASAVTLGGEGGTIYQRSYQSTYAYNIIHNGGHITGAYVDGWALVGNIVFYNGDNDTTDGGVIEWRGNVTSTRFASNIASLAGAANTSRAFSLKNDPPWIPSFNTIQDNVFRAMSIGAGGGAVLTSDSLQTVIEGNVCEQNSDTSGESVGISCKHVNAVIGNLVIPTGLRMLASFVADDTDGGQQITVRSNLVVGPVINVVQLNNPGPYPNALISGNACTDISSSVISNSTRPELNDGNAPGSFIGQINAAAGPTGQQAGAIGSAVLNTLGTQNQVFWYKETGAINTSTGWVVYGAQDLTFGAALGSTATANRFFAPGSIELAAETATEIQFAMPRAAKVRNLRVRCTAGTGGGNNTYRMRKNGADTAVQLTIANTATSGQDTSNSFTVVAGDKLSLRVSKTVAPTTPQANIVATYEVL